MMFSALESELPPNPEEPTYCICGEVSYGEMVACDNKDVILVHILFNSNDSVRLSGFTIPAWDWYISPRETGIVQPVENQDKAALTRWKPNNFMCAKKTW